MLTHAARRFIIRQVLCSTGFAGFASGTRAGCLPLRANLADEAGTVNTEHLRVGERIAEAFEVLECPNDLLVTRYLDDLRILFACMAVAENDVAVWQDLQRCNPSQLNTGQIILLDLPNDFLAGVTSMIP